MKAIRRSDTKIQSTEASTFSKNKAHSMVAIVHREYGSSDKLEIKTCKKPSVGDNDVLIRVCAAAVCKGDWHVMTGTPFLLRLGYGVFTPKNDILGQNLAGQVEVVGKNVTKFQPGDEVFGLIGSGAFAEYVCASEDKVVLKPAGISFEDAAAVPDSGLTALQGLRDKGKIQPGQEVMINGASGGVGTFAVQLAKFFGANVTGVCSTKNVELVRSIGADHVIDYTQTDFAKDSKHYDVVFDMIGNRPLSNFRRLLKPKGVYIGCAGEGGTWFGPLGRMLKMAIISRARHQRFVSYIAQAKPEDLKFLGSLIESKKLSPVIGRKGSLHEVPDALRHQGEGHARGKTVITF